MRVSLWVLLMAVGSAQAQTGTLTLRDAWSLAEEANPTLRAAQAGLAAAEGEARDAGRLLHGNPELSIERTRRTSPQAEGFDVRTRESAVGLSQTFEIAGQRVHRSAAAQRELEAVRTEVVETRARIRGEVEQAFFQALALQGRVAAEQENLELAADAAAAIGKRVAAGEDSRLDGNLAKVEAERARNQWATSIEQLAEARAKLAGLIQLPADRFPEVAGDLRATRPGYTLPALLASLPQRSRLRVLEHREEAARSRLALERASVFPDVTVGITSAREGPQEFRERVSTLSVTVPLPLFRRNDAGIGRAMTELTRAQIERQAAIRDGEAQVRSLWERLNSLEARVRRMSDSVLASLDENLSLSTKAYRAGEIGIVQLVLVNRQVLDARRDYLDALTEFLQARIALEQAAGWPTDSDSATTNSRSPRPAP